MDDKRLEEVGKFLGGKIQEAFIRTSTTCQDTDRDYQQESNTRITDLTSVPGFVSVEGVVDGWESLTSESDEILRAFVQQQMSKVELGPADGETLEQLQELMGRVSSEDFADTNTKLGALVTRVETAKLDWGTAGDIAFPEPSSPFGDDNAA